MEKQSSYLSTARLARAAAVRIALTFIGGLLTAFFAIGLFMTFTEADMRGDWPCALVLLIPSALLLWRGIRTGRDMELAHRYASCFVGDADGVVTLEERSKENTAIICRQAVEKPCCPLCRERWASTASSEGLYMFIM